MKENRPLKVVNKAVKKVVDRKCIKRATRFAIFERDGFRCKYCGVRPGTGNDIKLELDHMVPICEGGTNDPGNLVTACNVCNSGTAHFKVKLRVVNPFKKKTIVEDDKPEQIGLFG
jgi:5-methylcytosine-specific restriction endonuclease McrA